MIELSAFENLLKQTMGLDANSVGPALIERAVKERQARCGGVDLQTYWDGVNASAGELQELIEAVVVPETWFFRHRESYAALADVALAEWLRNRPPGANGTEGVLRLLSLPCSSGEEPYSMAMALLDAGLPASLFSIDAMDISRRALRSARRAFYGRNSFRSEDLGFRERHFTPHGQDWRVNMPVRRQVKFRHGNLFQNQLEHAYDVVFCRNVLIYFDRATQDRAIRAITQLLAAGGLLFVGPSETSLLQSHQFVSTKVPLAFAFRKGDVPATGVAVPAPAVRPVSALSRAQPPAPRAVAAPVTVSPARGPSPPETPEPPLDRAARLADEGRLPEATQLCEQYLAAHGPGAPVLYLLGLLRDAAGDATGASEHYRKALYLDPRHQEALTHLALLLEKQGNAEAAQVLRGRSERLLAKRQVGT